MIEIVNIDFDAESYEADIELRSFDICVTCYCHPLDSCEKIYNSTNCNLVAFLTEDIMIDDIPVPEAKKTNEGYYSYSLRGKVISKTQIQIYDFIIEIGAIPKDIAIGEYVSCRCLRLDLSM